MSSTLRRLVAGGATVALATVGVQVLATGSAFAHAVVVEGSAACQSDGTYTVSWTIANDYRYAEVSTVTRSTPVASTLTASSVSTVAYGSATISQTGIAGTASSAKLYVSSAWSDGFSRTNHGSVELEGTCLPGHVPAAPTWSDGSCSARAAVSPSITIPSDAGVTYRIVGQGPQAAGSYPEPAGKYTITARSTAYRLTGTASWTLQLVAGPTDCNQAVVPMSPVLTQSSCAEGSPSAPSLVQLGNDGVAYTVSADGPYSGGQAVTVTAKAQTGYEFTTVPTGWTLVNSTTATYLVTFAATPTCVTPQRPVVTEAGCAASSPALSMPATSGVAYTVSADGPYSGGQAVTVTASAQPGNQFGAPAPSGWTFVDASTETYQVEFAAAPDCTTATPPSFVDDTCAAFAATGASYTIPTITGMDYYVGGSPVTAGTHPATDDATTTVTAQPQPGYTLTGGASWTHTFTATPTCSGIEGVTVTRPPHQAVPVSARQQRAALTPVAGLASTGVPVRELLLVGAALLLLGVGCIAMATGRRRSQG